MKPSKEETIAVMQRVFYFTGMTGYRLAAVLANKSGRPIRPHSIYNYRDGMTIPDYLVCLLSELTKGKVRPHEIRPDVFPAPGEKLPRAINALLCREEEKK